MFVGEAEIVGISAVLLWLEPARHIFCRELPSCGSGCEKTSKIACRPGRHIVLYAIFVISHYISPSLSLQSSLQGGVGLGWVGVGYFLRILLKAVSRLRHSLFLCR